MRHIVIRGILALVWLASAACSAAGGNLEMAGLYLLLCVVFFGSAYIAWRNGQGGKGGN